MAKDAEKLHIIFWHPPFTTSYAVIEHGNNMLGSNPVAVVQGGLCPAGKCKWCDDIRMRCASRRLA